MSRARHESHIHIVAPSVAHAAERLAWAWGQEGRQAWALDRHGGKSIAELYKERSKLARSIPPDRSVELAHARRRLSLAEQDHRDLRQGTGRWAGTPAGQAALAASQAALDYQRASDASEDKSHGRWAKHKARLEMRAVSVRFDEAMAGWRAVGEPCERSLRSHCQRLEADLACLEQAQHARDEFLARDPTRARTTGGAGPGRQGARKSRAPAPLESSPARTATLLPWRPRPRARPGLWHRPLTGNRNRGFPYSRCRFSERNTRYDTARAWVTQLPFSGELVKVALAATLPPVNPLTAALRPPWLRAAPCHPGFGQVDRLALRLPREADVGVRVGGGRARPGTKHWRLPGAGSSTRAD